VSEYADVVIQQLRALIARRPDDPDLVRALALAWDAGWIAGRTDQPIQANPLGAELA
jgi:hypothetical protein